MEFMGDILIGLLIGLALMLFYAFVELQISYEDKDED